MSILIKGMEMPMNCIVCPMQFGGMCYVQPPEIDEPRVAPTVDQCVSRASWCPLIEIPDGHGRLIDADAAIKSLPPIEDYDFAELCTLDTAKRLVRKALQIAPTVIPSDKEEVKE